MRRIIKWRRDGPPKCSFGPHCPTEQYSKNFWSEEGSPRNSLKTLPPPVFPLNFSDEKSGKKLRFSESWAKMEPKVSRIEIIFFAGKPGRSSCYLPCTAPVLSTALRREKKKHLRSKSSSSIRQRQRTELAKHRTKQNEHAGAYWRFQNEPALRPHWATLRG